MVKFETPMILGGNAGVRLNKVDRSARIDTIGATMSRNSVICALTAHAYIVIALPVYQNDGSPESPLLCSECMTKIIVVPVTFPVEAPR